MTTQQQRTTDLAGLALVVAAYVIWGFLALYFVALEPIGPLEIVGWRVVFTFIVCIIIVLATRRWRSVVAVCRDRRAMLLLAGAGIAIYLNWQCFLLGAAQDEIVQVALGYFMNPIVTAFLARVVLGEHLTRLQWAALAMCALAVGILAVGYGTMPWIAIGITVTFAAYSLLKKVAGGRAGAIEGVTVETTIILPVAIAQLIVVAATSGIMITEVPAHTTVLMVLSGVFTGAPLLLFAAGARRVPLVSTALVQVIAPVLAFLTGVVLLHEQMPAERWIGFSLIWIGVLLASIDLVRQHRAAHRASVAAGAVDLATTQEPRGS